ncbi:MAG: Smr/MutS family protein [Rhodopseudomonas palustris]|nr:Smr/MutS family protein [Rhodopseudomonas palustris]
MAAKKRRRNSIRFDPRNVKKLKRGKIEIEGRIDLHGMRQAEAHAALIQFIHGSASMGKRWVLVITGKDRRQESARMMWSGRSASHRVGC